MDSNRKKSNIETFASLTNKIFNDSRYLRLRYFILFSAGLSCVTIVYHTVLFSCGLYLLQNGVLVYIATFLVLSVGKIIDRPERIKLGILVAVVLGTLYAGITLIISNIQYYFFGFRERGFLERGLVAPETTIRTLWIELGSQIFFLLILVLISLFAGFLASVTNPTKIQE